MRDIYSLFDLEDKTALVTGASRGLGYGIAECLVRAGVDVMLANRDVAAGQRARERLEQHGTRVLATAADVSDSRSVDRLIQKTLDAFGRLDILVNNAAVLKRGPLVDLAEKDYDQMLDTNLKGYFLCARAACRIMAEQGGGKVINISSIRVRLVADERAAYCASKGGIAALTQAMALEWAPLGIQVNALAPGYFATQPSLSYFKARPDMQRKVIEGTPLGRIGQPQDLDGAVIYLASGASNYVTGETLYVDGGWSTWKH